MARSVFLIGLTTLASFTLLLQCWAAPTGPPHRLNEHHPTSPPLGQHSEIHPSQRQLSGRHEKVSADASGFRYSSDFESDLGKFLNEYFSPHSDPDSLIPVPDHLKASILRPHDVHQQPISSSGDHQSMSTQGPASPKEGHQAVGKSQQPINMISHSPGSIGTPQSHIYLPSPFLKHTEEDPTGTAHHFRGAGGIEKLGRRRELLGKAADAITTDFANSQGISYPQARNLLHRRLDDRPANMLKDPKRFEEGAASLAPYPQRANVRPLYQRMQMFGNTQVKDLMPSTSTSTGGEGSKRKVINDNAEKKGVTEEAGSQPAKRVRMEQGNEPARMNRVRRYQHAETILNSKVIGAMVAVHRARFNLHPFSSHTYVRKAISSDPEGAPQLAMAVLSKDPNTVEAALDKIGHLPGPIVKKRLDLGFGLTDELAEKVVKKVVAIRKCRRDKALEILQRDLTAEIAEELKEPIKFEATIDKLLPRRTYNVPSKRIKRDPESPSELGYGLPVHVEEKALEKVLTIRKWGRDYALNYLKEHLTTEITQNLRNPLQFQAGMNQLFPRGPNKAQKKGRTSQ